MMKIKRLRPVAIPIAAISLLNSLAANDNSRFNASLTINIIPAGKEEQE